MGWITDWLKEIPLSALLREKLSDLEAEHARVIAENKVLTTDNSDLRAQVEAAHREIEKLKERDKKAIWHGSNLPEIQTRILQLVAQHGAIEADQIAGAASCGSEVAKFHVDELFKLRLVKWSNGQDFRTLWHLDHEGRRHLIQRGLLK